MFNSRAFSTLRGQRASLLFSRSRAARPTTPKRPNSTSGKQPRDGSSSRAQSRVDSIYARLPPYLQKYTTGLRNAPVSHVVSFLILHEVTAVVPLLGLFGLFHYTDYVPLGYLMDHYGSYVRDGLRRFEKYFRRKGWFGFGQDDEEASKSLDGQNGDDKAVLEKWENASPKYRILVEVALAYTVVKVLLPVRIALSVWATPWTAGLFARLRALVTRSSKTSK